MNKTATPGQDGQTSDSETAAQLAGSLRLLSLQQGKDATHDSNRFTGLMSEPSNTLLEYDAFYGGIDELHQFGIGVQSHPLQPVAANRSVVRHHHVDRLAQRLGAPRLQ